MPQRLMVHETDPAQKIWQEIGDLSEIEVTGAQVLCAIYLRPEKTASGLLLPDRNRDEDMFQGKVGLLVKLGPLAFQYPGDDRFGALVQGSEGAAETGDWLAFRPSDGFSIGVNGAACRLLRDEDIRMRIPHPDSIW